MKTKAPKMSYFLVVIFFIFGCQQRPAIKNINSTGKNIICFGNSITWGYGVEKEDSYPAQLERMLGMPVINAGVDGDTTPEALRRFKTDVLDRLPRLVIIEIGGNDFLRRIPIETTIANIEMMVKEAQEKGAMVALVDISAGPFLKEYRRQLSLLAVKTGSLFVPAVMQGILTKSSLKSDFIHPNKEGYRLIAQRVYEVLSPYLKSTAHKTPAS